MAPKYSTTLKTVKVGGKSYKQPTISASSFTKAVKKVINKQAETKSYLNTTNSAALTDDIVYAWNLVSGIPQGDDSDDRIGNKIHIKNIYAKLQLTAANNASATNASKHHRVMIIKTKKALTNSWTSVSGSDIFRLGTTTISALRGFPDRNKVTVLYDKLVSNETELSNTDSSRGLTINLKVDKTEYFEDDASLYLKHGNYYLLVICTSGVGTGFTAGAVNFNYAINFKDI